LQLYWNQQLLNALLDYPIQSDRSEFAIRLRVDRLGQKVSSALRFLPPGGPGGATRAFELHGGRHSSLTSREPHAGQRRSRVGRTGGR